MKKLIALFLTVLMVFSSLSVFGLDYAEEWNNYSDVNTQVYSDVPPTHWSCNAVNRVSATDWFSGYPDGTFRPNAQITREEAMKVIVKFLGLELKTTTTSSYYDVDASRWSSPYIEAGKLLFPQIETFNGQHPFQPDMPIKREDVIYAMVIAKKYNNEVKFADQSVLNMFSDTSSISAMIKPYVAVAVSIGLVAGKDGAIGAQDPLTRAEFATLLYRATYIGNGTGGGLQDVVAVESVQLTTPLVSELTVGQKMSITANAKLTDGTTVDYTINLNPYNSSNNNVVLMNKYEVTAVSAGTAVIKFNGDPFLADESLVINVKAPVVDDDDEEETRRPVEDEEDPRRPTDNEEEEETRRPTEEEETEDASLVSLAWSVDSLVLNAGETSQIKLVGTYSDGTTKDLTRKYTLYSTDENVFEINSNGKITALGTGKAKVNLRSESQGVLAVSVPRPLSVEVRSSSRREITALEWAVDELTLEAGATKTITLNAVYSDGSKEDITEECGVYAMDEDIAVVDGKEIKAISAGETELWFDNIPTAGIDLPDMLIVTVE